MEKKLMKWFQLAEKWGAVMLIDEADVFLEKRVTSDLKRNSLVSVFLRCVEYYRGVLFLTTNRVGQFDDAFMSRIHVVIHYKSLTPQDRKKIWRQFFKKLSSERTDFRITRRAQDYVLEDKDITSMPWNGREIRNAFQTAVALADFRFLQIEDKDENDVPTLDQEDFEEVCSMMIKFKDYLKDLHGKDED
ncbi:P-loop containing nucleoside triphosphate hydrolase protein, partial [Neurospora crassa]